jgi:predicted esterase
MSQYHHPDPFIVQPTSHHTQTLILLHGLGSNGEKFGTELLATGTTSAGQTLPEIFPGARFVFPTAKRRRSTAFNRAVITQWFDIASVDDPSFGCDKQYDGLADSRRHLLKILMGETELVPPERIILGGLSHGCAMGLAFMLGLDFALGGFVGMSGWLPFQRDLHDILNSSLPDEAEDIFDRTEAGEGSRDATVDALLFQREILSTERNDTDKIKNCLSTPVFIGHGEVDEKVKVSLGEGIVSTLRSMGVDVTWRLYQDQGHWYRIPEEVDDIVQFIDVKTSFRAVTT